MSGKLETRILKDLPPSAILPIYQSAGWWKEDYGLEFLSQIVRESFSFAATFDGEKLVGIGRALSDACSDAYIQDVAVLPEYRGKGVGSQIIKALIEDLQKHGVDWIALVGEPGTEAFYEKLGFKAMDGYIPMRYTAADRPEK
ncbi:MAG: GNAT family N-acetyltransferase [Lentisphaerae bacterium GWF2_52_8]|nr:MAG: GNAT family N-acetyltransferase [Lentisphaerae bacterium GWF2_52_8]